VLHGHAGISSNLAIRLEAAGAGTARSWLAMQMAYDLAAAQSTAPPVVRRLDEVA
jgi:transcriptional regulator, XRE family protein